MMAFNSFSLRPLVGLAIAAGIFAMLPFHSVAVDLAPKLITDWYQALRQNDHELMETLLDAEGLVELKDIGVTQTKSEFMDSLDEWSELNTDTSLYTRINSINANEVVMDVCYRFTANQVQTREVFVIAGNRITRSIQEQVADTCTGIWE